MGARSAVGLTSLHLAAFQGYDAVTKVLVNSGADWNAIDKYGRLSKAEMETDLNAVGVFIGVLGMLLMIPATEAVGYEGKILLGRDEPGVGLRSREG